MPFFAIDDQVGHQNVIVLGVHTLGAGLVVPHVLTGVGVHGDDAFAEKPVTGGLDESELSVVHADTRRAEDDQAGGLVISDGVPNVATADPPPSVAGPGFCRHFQRFRFEWLGRITRNSPEAPRFPPGFCIIGDQRPAHAVVRSVERRQ